MRSIAGYNGKYLVSEDGKIYSVRRKGCNGRYLKSRPNSSGYLRVDLRKGKNKKTVFVHRIVAETFIPNPENKRCINHIDGNKSNNSVSNLEWCSHSENMKHAVKNHLNKFPCLKGEEHPNSKLTQTEVNTIRSLRETGASAYKIAKKYNVSSTAIYNIWRNKTWN